MNANPAAATRIDVVDQVAHLWAQGLADQEARTFEDAARAAGHATPAAIEVWVLRHYPDVVAGPSA